MSLSHRILFIVVFLSCFVFDNAATAQLWRYISDSGKIDKNYQKQDAFYNIMSLDGAPCKIRVVRRVLSDGVTRIKSSTDSLGIASTMGIDTVFFLNRNLLEIVYSPHGGSNDGYENTLLLCVNKGKFCIAMEVMSNHVFGAAGPEGIYDLSVKLMNQEKHDIQLLVNIHDVDSSTIKGAKHYDRRSKFVLNYDKRRNVFYNDVRHIDAVVNMWESHSYKTKPKHIKGDYPVIKLGESEYYFINETWYVGVRDDSTGKYSFDACCESLRPKKT
jgi:hypothetical protein